MVYAKYGIECKQNFYQDQNGEIHNEYHFQTQTGFYLGALRFPGDLQFGFDSQIMDLVMKALAIRYGYIKPPKKRIT